MMTLFVDYLFSRSNPARSKAASITNSISLSRGMSSFITCPMFGIGFAFCVKYPHLLQQILLLLRRQSGGLPHTLRHCDRLHLHDARLVIKYAACPVMCHAICEKTRKQQAPGNIQNDGQVPRNMICQANSVVERPVDSMAR
jgi:hypothetical protein